MLIVDSNVLVAAVVGRSGALIRATAERGIDLSATDVAVVETRRIAIRFAPAADVVDTALEQLFAYVLPLAPAVYESLEPVARARLHPRAQPDWPTLAAALALGAAIWSNDRDFSGTGVAVWTTRNVGYAEPVQ